MPFTGQYGSPVSFAPWALPSVVGHTTPLIDASTGVFTLTTAPNGTGAKRIYLQLPSRDESDVAFEAELKVYFNINLDAGPVIGTAGPRLALVPNDAIIALDLYPRMAAAKIAYRVSRGAAPTGTLDWGKSLFIVAVFEWSLGMKISALLANATDAAVNTTFGRMWLCWILAGVALEIYALIRPEKGDTLSEWVWFVRAIPGYGTFALWMLSAFLLWLIAHFATKAV